MSNSIPDFHKQVQPLNEIFEKEYAHAAKRKTSALKHSLDHKLSWDSERNAELATIQDSVLRAIALAFCKRKLCYICFRGCVRRTLGWSLDTNA